jgi:hypothetical protein
MYSAADTLPALAVPTVGLAAGEPDPIFTLIEHWKEALAFSNGTFDHPKEEQAALDEEHVAMKAVLSAVPTTLAGMGAKIDFAFSADHVSSQSRQLSDGRLYRRSAA